VRGVMWCWSDLAAGELGVGSVCCRACGRQVTDAGSLSMNVGDNVMNKARGRVMTKPSSVERSA